MDELKELQLVVEKERRELTDVLCDLSVTGKYIYTLTLFRFLTLHLVGLSIYSVDTQVQLYKALLSL